MIEGATERQSEVYRAGRNARTHNSKKEPPSHLTWEERHWWLAGWNDLDIEIDSHKTQAKVVRRGKP